MRIDGKPGVPVVFATHNEPFMGHLNESFFYKTTQTGAIDDRRGFQIRFSKKSPVDFARIVRKKLLNSLSDFLGEHQLPVGNVFAGSKLSPVSFGNVAHLVLAGVSPEDFWPSSFKGSLVYS